MQAINVILSKALPIVTSGSINGVNARDLYEWLEVGKDFSDWIKGRITKNNFIEDEDFITYSHKKGKTNGRPKIEYIISQNMAKHISQMQHNNKGHEARQYFIDIEEIDDYEEEKRWEQEKKWEMLSIAKNREELKKEINTLNRLIDMAKEILKEEDEVKLQQLEKAIEEGLKKIRKMQGNEKILIFSESRDTMEYLVERIKSWGHSVNFIHGGMRLEDRVNAEKVFQHEKQIMVATEAAGEGINLQFCHLMINYDIPWNPNRLEQRMERIHRH